MYGPQKRGESDEPEDDRQGVGEGVSPDVNRESKDELPDVERGTDGEAVEQAEDQEYRSDEARMLPGSRNQQAPDSAGYRLPSQLYLTVAPH